MLGALRLKAKAAKVGVEDDSATLSTWSVATASTISEAPAPAAPEAEAPAAYACTPAPAPGPAPGREWEQEREWVGAGELASAALFFGSSAAERVSGQVLFINAGLEPDESECDEEDG